MTVVLKKTNTLFHSIRDYSNLLQILIDKGFKASYADEIIAGYSAKILMISFSNVALFESRSQINYGNYSIGMSLDWGKRNKLQPVMYSYGESEMGFRFIENYFISKKDHTILEVLHDQGEKQNFGLIVDIKQISSNTFYMLMYLKPYIVMNKAGQEFIAYNDREWRFIFQNEDSHPILFERDMFTGARYLDYEEAKAYPKPFTKHPVLHFDLSDIKYIVVETKSQKKNVVDNLTAAFGYEEVLEKIVTGDLDILSRDTMWDNL